MSAEPSTAPRHRIRQMAGRNPHETGRVATPLELLFDLTFVVAVGQAASLFAHEVTSGHVVSGLVAFPYAVFAVMWAWINFSWFASAFDTDDIPFRLATMVQMVGVCILALGLPALFDSIAEGEHVDNRVVILGYVVMRLAMVFQWLRAARQAPEYRRACLTYAKAIVIAQAGWIVVALVDMPLAPTMVATTVLILVEFVGPYLAEKRYGGTPWHAHHIAERYSLFAIIALGEGIVGTVAVLASAEEAAHGISADVLMVGTAGIGLTFGMWWTYFIMPSAQVLHVHRERSFGWGYGHIVLIGAIVATGAGLDVSALYIEDRSQLGAAASVAFVAVPVGVYLLSVMVLYSLLLHSADPFHLWILLAAAVPLVASVALAAAGVALPVCLLVAMLAPALIAASYETMGHRHVTADLQRLHE